MKRLATYLIDGLIAVCLATAAYLVSRPSSTIRVAWSQFQTHRRQVKAAARLWPTLVANSTPLSRVSGDVQVIEIADYECPFCRTTQPAVDSAIAQGIRIAFLNYPLSQHRHARDAALAAMCAARVGAFRPMHDGLIRSEQWMADADWRREANAAGIEDSASFSACMRDGNTHRQLDAAKAWGDSVFVQGTPTFVARGDVSTGVLTTAQLIKLGHQ